MKKLNENNNDESEKASKLEKGKQDWSLTNMTSRKQLSTYLLGSLFMIIISLTVMLFSYMVELGGNPSNKLQVILMICLLPFAWGVIRTLKICVKITDTMPNSNQLIHAAAVQSIVEDMEKKFEETHETIYLKFKDWKLSKKIVFLGLNLFCLSSLAFFAITGYIRDGYWVIIPMILCGISGIIIIFSSWAILRRKIIEKESYEEKKP